MSRKRIPLEIQEKLRAYYSDIIPEIVPNLGFNPFVRALLFFFSDLNNHLKQHIIHRGAELERAFEKGSYELNPTVIEVEIGCSKTEQALFDYMTEYLKYPFGLPPDEVIDLNEGYNRFMKQREQIKNELREEILDELRKDQQEKP